MPYCAADRLRSIGAVAYAGRADILAGRALARAGEPKAAIERLEQVHATLADCRAKGHRDDAARELRVLGCRPGRRGSARRAQTDGIGALTERERDVAELIVVGLTNRQIAERLVISEKTVESHVTRILAKLGVSSRVAVVGILPTLT